MATSKRATFACALKTMHSQDNAFPRQIDLHSCRGWTPVNSKCKTCKSTLHQEAKYCQGCAYAKGICAMCGKQILDVTGYKQSTS